MTVFLNQGFIGDMALRIESQRMGYELAYNDDKGKNYGQRVYPKSIAMYARQLVR